MDWERRESTYEDLADEGDGYYTIRMHHSGKVGHFDFGHSDKMSALELFAMTKQLGIGMDKVISFQYKLQDHGWKEVISNVDALEMGLFVDSSRVIDIYVKESSVNVNIQSQVQSNIVSSTSKHEVDAEYEVDAVAGYCVNSDSSDLYSVNEGTNSENGTDGSYQLSNDYRVEDDDALYEAAVDHEVEFVGIRNEDEQGTREGQTEATSKDNTREGNDSDNLRSLSSSSDGEERKTETLSRKQMLKYTRFNPATDMDDPKFCLGMIFSTTEVVRNALRNYSIKNGKDHKYIMNEKFRIRAACKDPKCDWLFFASKMQGESSILIKTLRKKHKCNRAWKVSKLNSAWIAENYKLNSAEGSTSTCSHSSSLVVRLSPLTTSSSMGFCSSNTSSYQSVAVPVLRGPSPTTRSMGVHSSSSTSTTMNVNVASQVQQSTGARLSKEELRRIRNHSAK